MAIQKRINFFAQRYPQTKMQRVNTHTIILIALASPALTHVQAQKNFMITPSEQPVVIDGHLDDESWQQADDIRDFERNFPDDKTKATYTTEVKLTFDQDHLYVAARMYRNEQKGYSVTSLKEDFTFYENDAFGIVLDPYNDLTNGYGFYVNAYGARRDEQISAGTVADATMDIQWKAEVVRTPTYYTVEMAIPLRYIRHSDSPFWNVNFVRNDMSTNERSSWVRTPINFLLGNLAFVGQMHWPSHLNIQKKLYSFIPSLTATETKEGEASFSGKLKPSLDTKLALSSSLNMDVTINPDFSQAEVDKVQINLTRFELAFPENRLFFVENSDLFSAFGDDSWGNPAARPFYSRKIGLRYDSATAGYVSAPIIGGTRVSGKVNNNLRVGGMTLFTQPEKMGEQYIPSQNYSVLAAQHKLMARSNLAVMMVNRQAFGTDSLQKFSFNSNNYNRTVALEYNFASRDDKLSGKVYRHFMFDSRKGNNKYAQGFLFRHNTRAWRNWFQVTQISEDFQPDVGFVPRTNVLGVNVQGSYNFYPKKGLINQFEIVTNPQLFLTADGRYSDHFLISGIHFITRKTQDFWLVHIQERITLREPFNPVFTDNHKLDSGTVNTYDYVRLSYTSDTRQPFYWSSTIDAGGYYNGTQVRAEGSFNYRVQPWGILGLNYNINRFSLPKPFNENRIYYIGPRAEFSFTRNLFFTSVVQYNSQADNMNYYARFQWRFRPLSDFYIIYSGNQNTQLNSFHNHNLVMKIIVWL